MICDDCILKTDVSHFIIAEWDEMIGPKLAGYGGNLLFGIDANELQGLVENLFMIIMGIYGNQFNLNDPSHVILPIKYFHSMSLESFIYFDAKKDEKFRNGQLLNMIVFITKKICHDFENDYMKIFKNEFKEFITQNENQESIELLKKLSGKLKLFHDNAKTTFTNPLLCNLS